MARLTEKYKPLELSDFVGLDTPKKIIANWLQNPQAQSFLFVGDSGTGKTAMGYAIARALGIDPASPEAHFSLIDVPSRKCNAEMVDHIIERTQYMPWAKLWVIMIQEADQMTPAAQIAFLSVLDNLPKNAVIIFTCNETERLEPRFLSRCLQVKFSNYGLNGDGSRFLSQVWSREQGSMKQAALIEPDFVRLLKNCRNNLRDALMHLESELLSA